MTRDLHELIEHHRRLGAPEDQNALKSLLRAIQEDHGGAIPRPALTQAAQALGVKEALLLALVRRLPSLRLADTNVLELCAGPNCARARTLLAAAQELHRAHPDRFTLKTVPCMHNCAHSPNLRWNNTLYPNATPQLLQTLLDSDKR